MGASPRWPSTTASRSSPRRGGRRRPARPDRTRSDGRDRHPGRDVARDHARGGAAGRRPGSSPGMARWAGRERRDPRGGMSGDYHDAELETLPWREVEAWQGSRLAQSIERIRATSVFYRGGCRPSRPAKASTRSGTFRRPRRTSSARRRRRLCPASHLVRSRRSTSPTRPDRLLLGDDRTAPLLRPHAS